MALPNKVKNVVAPNLPIASSVYSQQYADEYSNVLRLYFNQLSNFNNTLISLNGGSSFTFPHIAASYATNQYATNNNTPTIVKWSSLEAGSGFTLNANNTATALYSGIYKITYSLQFANNINAEHDAIVWLRVNGNTFNNDVANSTTIFSIPARKNSGSPSYVCGYSEVVFALNAGESVGLWWGTSQAATLSGTQGIYIYGQANQTTPMIYPATPSAIGSITFVSALY